MIICMTACCKSKICSLTTNDKIKVIAEAKNKVQLLKESHTCPTHIMEAAKPRYKEAGTMVYLQDSLINC